MAALRICYEMVVLRICYDKAIADAKESGEKLVTFIEHMHREQEEAQKVKSERNELSQAST
jgi:hypothetical protein